MHLKILWFLFLPILIGVPRMSTQSRNQNQHSFVTANGIHIYYERWGSGPYLILIEGLGVATWLWEKQVPEFSKHFTTIVYDNRGVGQSDKPAGPYSVEMLADDLAGLMQTLNIPKAHILGVSMGGFIAQDFALRYPQKVNKLVLVSTSAGGAEHVPMSQETLARFFATHPNPREQIRQKLSLAYTETYLKKEADHLIDLRLQNPQPQHAFQAQVAAGISVNLSDKVQDIHCPTLIAAATKDLIVPVENAHNLHNKIQGSRLLIYDDLGHQFFVEIPQAFNRDVINFLKN